MWSLILKDSDMLAVRREQIPTALNFGYRGRLTTVYILNLITLEETFKKINNEYKAVVNFHYYELIYFNIVVFSNIFQRWNWEVSYTDFCMVCFLIFKF